MAYPGGGQRPEVECNRLMMRLDSGDDLRLLYMKNEGYKWNGGERSRR